MNAQQLRNSILQQAIQGKLVPQDPTDEPASVLLQRIRKEKERLVKEGKLKKKDLESKPIEGDEIPFEIPMGWEWGRIKEVFSMQAGKFVSASDISDEQTNENNYPCYGGNGLRGYVKKFNNDGYFTLVGRQGALCGNVQIVKGKFYATEHAVVTDGFGLTDVKWAYYFLTALKLNQYATATAQPGLAVSNVLEVLLPLPPLAEQRRIVAKIEELMPLVERYGKAQQALDQLNESLPAHLRQSILQEAIQGRLVPQDPKEEPASELLKRIRKEKEQLVKEGKLKKKDLESKPIEEDEIPFEIPESWEWVKIEDVTIPIGNKNNQIQSKEVLKEGKVAVVSQGKELIDGYSNEIDKTIKELPLIMFGDHTRNVKYIDFPFVIGADGTKYFKPILCDARFMYYLVLHIASKLRDRGYARHYSLLKEEPLPLPPLSEQKRIVAKVEELFGVTDFLSLCHKTNP